MVAPIQIGALQQHLPSLYLGGFWYFPQQALRVHTKKSSSCGNHVAFIPFFLSCSGPTCPQLPLRTCLKTSCVPRLHCCLSQQCKYRGKCPAALCQAMSPGKAPEIARQGACDQSLPVQPTCHTEPSQRAALIQSLAWPCGERGSSPLPVTAALPEMAEPPLDGLLKVSE